MIIVSIVIVTSIILAYLEDINKVKKGLALGFILFVSIFSLRYRYGNDYMSYYGIFNYIANFNRIEQAISYHNYEIGWVLLNYLLKPLGFQVVIMITTLIPNILIYRLIKDFAPKGLYWLAVSFYLLNPDLFLLNLSMIRQGLSEIFILYAICHATRNKIIVPIIFSIVAFSMHNSAIICLPVIIAAFFYKYLSNKYIIGMIGLFFLMIILNGNLVYEYLMKGVALTDDIEVYEKYIRGGENQVSMGYGVFLQFLAVFPLLKNIKKCNSDLIFFLAIYLFSFLLIPFASFATMVLRLRGYFTIFGIILFPMYLNYNSTLKKQDGWRLIAISSIIIYIIYSYISFFNSTTYGAAYSTFQINV